MRGSSRGSNDGHGESHTHQDLVELAEVSAAESLFDRLQTVYLGSTQTVPLDKPTLVEHVHQTLMYLNLLTRRLREQHERTGDHLQRQDRMEQALLDSSKQVHDLSARNEQLRLRLASATAAVTALREQVPTLQQQLTDAKLEVVRHEAAAAEAQADAAAQAQLVAELQHRVDAATGAGAGAGPGAIVATATATSTATDNDNDGDAAACDATAPSALDTSLAEVSPHAGVEAPPRTPARIRAASATILEGLFSPRSTRSASVGGEDVAAAGGEDVEFALEETERGHHRELLSQFSGQLSLLMDHIKEEATQRQRLEVDMAVLSKRYAAALDVRRLPVGAGSPRHAAGHVLLGRVFAPLAALSVSPAGDGNDSDASANAPSMDDVPGAAAGAGAGASTSAGLPDVLTTVQAAELLGAMQAYVCEVSQIVAPPRAASPIGTFDDDSDDEPPPTSASGRLREVRSTLQLMVEMASDLPVRRVPAALLPDDPSARCMRLLSLQLRLQRLLTLPSTLRAPHMTLVPPGAAIVAAALPRAGSATATASAKPSIHKRSGSPVRVARRHTSAASSAVAVSPASQEKLLRDFSPAPQRPGSSRTDASPGAGSRHVRSSSSASDLTDTSFTVVSVTRSVPSSSLELLARDPGVNFSRLEQFLARVLDGIWQQWTTVSQIASVVCDAATYELSRDAAARWVPDHAVSSCTACRRPFKFTRRRHHCRCCGGVFCTPCSSKQLDLGMLGVPVAHSPDDKRAADPSYARAAAAAARVCDACFSVLSKLPPLA